MYQYLNTLKQCGKPYELKQWGKFYDMTRET